MISPKRYAQHVKDNMTASFSNEVADIVMARAAIEPDVFARIVGEIPRCIPAKYHKILSDILITACVGKLCKNATYSISLREKHKILQRTLLYTGNVRES